MTDRLCHLAAKVLALPPEPQPGSRWVTAAREGDRDPRRLVVTGHPIDLGPGEPVVVPVAWVREDEVPIERFYPGCGVSGRLRLVPDERGAA